MYEDGPKCNTLAAREPIAAEIVKFAIELADRSERLAERVGGKLHPVATSPTPLPCREELKGHREYPPLFNELNGLFRRLQSSLDNIEETMSRVEL